MFFSYKIILKAIYNLFTFRSNPYRMLVWPGSKSLARDQPVRNPMQTLQCQSGRFGDRSDRFGSFPRHLLEDRSAGKGNASRGKWTSNFQYWRRIDIEMDFKVQMTFYQRLRERKLSTRFFKSLTQKMQTAQNRIRADIINGSSVRMRPSTVNSVKQL